VGLTKITPFEPDEYERRAAPLVDWAVSSAESLWGLSWRDLVERHSWRGGNLRAALAYRRQLSAQLKRAQTLDEFSEAVTAITRWGGLPSFGADDIAAVASTLRALDDLDEGNLDAEGRIFGRRIAAASKVYAMHDPARWIIYDSRVARALALIVVSCKGSLDPGVTRFPQPPGRIIGRGVPGFQTLGAGSSRQAALVFVYSSWLSRKIAGRLNEIGEPNPAGDQWSALHVELALFTAGGIQPDNTPSEGDKVPAVSAAGKTAGFIGGALVPSRLAEQGADVARTEAQRMLDKQNAFRNAVRYSQQTGSKMARLQFSNGDQHYVIFKGDEAIAAFPEFLGDLSEALVHHEMDKLPKLSPREALDARRSAKAKRTILEKIRGTGEDVAAAASSATGFEFTKATLELPAGDPLGDDELLDEIFDDS